MSVHEYIKSHIREATRPKKLNIIVIGTTHERYEQALALTGHNFYCVSEGKTWDKDYGQIPNNYEIINEIPQYLPIDLILIHTSCKRAEIALNMKQFFNVPVIRHTHVLPDIRFNIEEQICAFRSIPVDLNTFISDFSRKAWGYTEHNSMVVDHGLDTDFWCVESEIERNNYLLSVVNLWKDRDWACGWKLWNFVIKNGLPFKVVGKNEGLSKPANSIEELRSEYQKSKIFLNTSLHSPVPMSLLEAMACGCAIVSTNTCMIPEVVKHGYNGLISDDPIMLRKYCTDLLFDNNFAKMLGDNARKTIIEKYNIQRFINRWNEIFQKVLK